MTAPVAIPANTWTNIKAAGFGAVMVQALGCALQIDLSSGAPGTASSGLLVPEGEQMQISTSDTAANLWARPLEAGQSGYARLAVTGVNSSGGNQVTLTDKSGTIASGGVAQTIMAANSSRRGFMVQNVSSGDLWISSLATAVANQPSIKIPSGSMYESPANAVPTGAVSIIGATTGQAFTAREWN